MSSKSVHQEKSLVANESREVRSPILASGNQAVAAIAAALMKLGPSQRKFLLLRSDYESDAACAKQVGVAAATIKKWKANNALFAAAYRELPTQPLLHARAEFVLLVPQAVNTLGELLDGPNSYVRLDAAEKILKGRDAQLLTNNLKVEPTDGSDRYSMLQGRLAARMAQRPAAETEPADGGAVEAEFREMPATPTEPPPSNVNERRDGNASSSLLDEADGARRPAASVTSNDDSPPTAPVP